MSYIVWIIIYCAYFWFNFFLKEKVILKKIVGSILIIVANIMLSIDRNGEYLLINILPCYLFIIFFLQ